MSAHRFCENCGVPLREGVNFCESCGAPREASGESVSAPPSLKASEPVKSGSRENVPPPQPAAAGQATWSHIALKGGIAAGALLLVGGGGWWLGRDRDVEKPQKIATPAPPASDQAPPFQNQAPVESAASPPAQPAVAKVPIPVTPTPSLPPVAPNPQQAPRDTATADGGSPGVALIQGGDFSAGTPTGLAGDGARVGQGGKAAWQLRGPDDMAISIPLAASPGRGLLQVRYRVFLAEGTPIDADLGGVRLRARLTDRDESSAVSDRVLNPSANWQPVELSFKDTGSGPYTLWIEAFGFTGPLLLDDIVVFASAAADGTKSASPPGAKTTGESGAASATEATELERWVMGRPWFKQVARSMPPGVTLTVKELAAPNEGWGAFEICERHPPGSVFDPDAGPLVGRFQVSPQRDGIAWLDIVNSEWQPIEDFFAKQGLNDAQP